MRVNMRRAGQASVTAPALEKGLDLLEALAEEPDGLTQKAIAERVGRSVGEIFRMLGVLELRGYVLRDGPSGRYRLTLRLFELAHRNPPTRLLLQAAEGAMGRLANEIGHACHLVGLHGERILVIAQSQPERQLMGWAVRVGAGFPLSHTFASARVLVAFQRPERRAILIERMGAADGKRADPAIAARLEAIARGGFDMAASLTTQGVTDISFPVLDHFGNAIAALTVPIVLAHDDPTAPAQFIAPIRDAAGAISRAIGGRAT